MYYNSEPTLEVEWAMVLLNFFRGLTGFRCFDGTRYYVKLILKSASDIKSFLFIFFYTTFAFGVISAVATGNKINFTTGWITSFDVNLGNFMHEENLNLGYIMFFIASIINVIVMLNLLISILSNSFAEFQVTASENDYMEMAQCVFEIETLMLIANSKKNEFEYLLIWDRPANGENYTKGRVKRQAKPVEKNVENLKEEMAALKDYNKKIFQKLELIEKKLL